MEYISPELWSGKDYSFEYDYWQMGVLLYEMLNGFAPAFEGTTGEESDLAMATDS